ncbi:glycosyltransferase family 4 protein [Paenibacillus sp. NPDC058071]|uniref:glycosyltransferase family 4 protein n=1 Tax=Paenibacillus sp. NPDC058071 TaxID=3346326 RepID=UPI0036D8E7AC
MYILLSIHHPLDENAGAPGVTYRLGEQYRRLGHSVALFSFDQLPSYIPGKLKPLFFPFFLWRQIRKLASEKKLDVVDASSGDAWLWSLLRSRRNGPILVTRSHGLEHTMHESLLEEERRGHLRLSWKYPLYHGGLRLKEVAISFRRADGSLFLNQRDYDYALRRLKVEGANSRIVRNGLPDAFLGLPIEWGAAGQAIRIAQIGSYIPRKGIRYTAAALNGLLRWYPHVSISFIGTGCSVERVLEDYDEEVHSQISVVERYRQVELPALLTGHQIKLFPTLSEGFPLSLIEAMACGLAPVTAFSTDAFLQDGHNALIIPARDSQAIAQKLELLLANPQRLREIRVQAYETAQTYGWSRIAQDTLDYYESLAEKRRDGQGERIG